MTVNNSSWTKYSALSDWSNTRATEKILINPFNKLRSNYGLSQIKSIDEELEGDFGLWTDTSDFSPVREMPANKQFIGPIFWEDYMPEVSFSNLMDNYVVVLDFGVHFEDPIANAIRNLCISSGAGIIEILHSNNDFSTRLTYKSSNYLQVDYCLARNALAIGEFVITDGNLETIYRCLALDKPVVGISLGGEEDLYINRLIQMRIAKTFSRQTVHNLVKHLSSVKLLRNYTLEDLFKPNSFVDNNPCASSRKIIDSIIRS